MHSLERCSGKCCFFFVFNDYCFFALYYITWSINFCSLSLKSNLVCILKRQSNKLHYFEFWKSRKLFASTKAKHVCFIGTYILILLREFKALKWMKTICLMSIACKYIKCCIPSICASVYITCQHTLMVGQPYSLVIVLSKLIGSSSRIRFVENY